MAGICISIVLHRKCHGYTHLWGAAHSTNLCSINPLIAVRYYMNARLRTRYIYIRYLYIGAVCFSMPRRRLVTYKSARRERECSAPRVLISIKIVKIAFGRTYVEIHTATLRCFSFLEIRWKILYITKILYNIYSYPMYTPLIFLYSFFPLRFSSNPP